MLTCPIWRKPGFAQRREAGQAHCTWLLLFGSLLQISTAHTCGLNPRLGAVCSLQAGTYNVNGRPPPLGLDLRPWLDAGAGADIVALAFQECVPLSASNVVMGAPRVSQLLTNIQMCCMC